MKLLIKMPNAAPGRLQTSITVPQVIFPVLQVPYPSGQKAIPATISGTHRRRILTISIPTRIGLIIIFGFSIMLLIPVPY
jgi:hypothetical protein